MGKGDGLDTAVDVPQRAHKVECAHNLLLTASAIIVGDVA